MKIFKLIIALLISISGFLNFSEITSFASEKTTLSKNMSEAKSISFSKIYTDSLHEFNKEDYFKFTLKEDGQISVKVSSNAIPGDSSHQYYVRILDAYNNSYKSTNVVGFDGGTYFRLGLKKGTYYINIKHDSYYYTKPPIKYSFKVNFKKGYYERENNDSMSYATKLYSNKTLTGRIDNSDDSDYYKFTIPKNGKISINLKTKTYPGNESYYYNIKLLTAQNNEYFDRNISAKNGSFSMPVGLPKGTYYIKISPWSRYDYLESDYKLSYIFEDTSNFEIESNDTMSTANILALGSIKEGNNYTDNLDYFKIKIKESGNYSFKFTHNHSCHNGSCWYIDLLDSSNNSYGSITTGYYTSSASMNLNLKPGTYYIKTESSRYSPESSYKISMRQNFKKDLSINTITTSNKTISGKGEKGSTVTAYVGKKKLGSTTVDRNGNFKLNIKPQKYKTKLTFKMTKSGYTTITKNKSVSLSKFKSPLTIRKVTNKTKTITGKGEKGSTVTAYVGKKKIGSTTVDKNGNFKLNIKPQKYKTKLTFKMTKTGYSTTTKALSVLR